MLAAEICTEPVDFSWLGPMITATRRELEHAGIARTPEIAVADAGFWNERHMDDLASGRNRGADPTRFRQTQGRATRMDRRTLQLDALAPEHRPRQRDLPTTRQSIEPVFGHTKHNRQFTHFHRRGRAAVRMEWRLLMMTHNVTKLHTHQIAAQGA